METNRRSQKGAWGEPGQGFRLLAVTGVRVWAGSVCLLVPLNRQVLTTQSHLSDLKIFGVKALTLRRFLLRKTLWYISS